MHARLDELLPGDGSLYERRQAWRDASLVDGALATPSSTTCCRSCARYTETVVELPAGEELNVEPVTDEPWWAFNYYLGNLQSRVVLNVDVPTTGFDLIHSRRTRSIRAITPSMPSRSSC